MKYIVRKNNSGIAIYMAVVVTAALSLVALAIINLTIKQMSISNTSRDSQAAFYAADSGVECALFWDLKNTDVTNSGKSAFGTSSAAQNITCNNQSKAISVVNLATTTFSFTLPNNSCVTVGVFKTYLAGVPKTQIAAKGYNAGTVSGSSCTSSNARRVERAIYVSY
jgi:Tfp pilus assembly protein PilX